MPTMAIITAMPACVPATLSRPARVPWRMLVAMISVPSGRAPARLNRQAMT